MAHPLAGSLFRDIIKLIKLNGGIKLTKIPTIIFILLFSLLSIPSRLKESKLYDKKIASLTIPQPIFIIGHWRSGTTHLFYILAKDPQFSFFTQSQSLHPRNMIFPSLLMKFFGFSPKTRSSKPSKPSKPRPLDNVVLGSNEPQEEEFALCNLDVPSYFLGIYFLKNFDSYLKYLTLTHATPAEIKSWKDAIITIYKKEVFVRPDCSAILSKDPCHTSKIKYLLELFPQAKFIHIYRNPYRVYLSTVHMHKVVAKLFNLQDQVSDDVIKEHVFTVYHEMMEDFFKNQQLIPKENFIEIKFEDLELEPLEQIERIYSTLNIKGFTEAKDKIQSYLTTLSNYKKNVYKPLSEEMKNEIYKQLAFTIDKWGYSSN